MSKSTTISITEWIGILVITLISVLAFLPAFEADFVNWDDPDYIYDNEQVLHFGEQGLLAGLQDIFTNSVRKIYTPMTVLSYVIEDQLWGMDHPEMWHIDNLLLHLLTVFIVWLVSRRLGLQTWSALIVAALFALHPMRVESVMWLTERKDTLYALFYFLAIYAYLKKEDSDGSSKWNNVLWISFIIALFTKVLAVSLPIVLIIIDIYRGKPLSVKLILQKWPHFIVAFGFGVLGLYMASNYEIEAIQEVSFTLFERIALASYTMAMYFIKLVYPYEMLPIYKYPSQLGAIHYASLTLWILLILGMAWSYFKSKGKTLFFGLAFFLAVVIFMLQILPVGHGFMADRFTYVAYFGLFFMIGKGVDYILDQKPKWPLALAVPILLGYTHMSYTHSQVWVDSEKLWHHQMTVTPDLAPAWRNLSEHYEKHGPVERYEPTLLRSYALDPKHPGTLSKMGIHYGNKTTTEDQLKAIDYITQSLEQDDSFAGLYINRAAIYGHLGQVDQALEDLSRAIALDDQIAEAFLNRAVLLHRQKNYETALIDLDRYLNLVPNDADKWIIKGQMLATLNRVKDGLSSINQGISLNPQNGLYYFERALLHRQANNWAAAKSDIQKSQTLGYNGRPQVAQEILNK